MEIKDLDTKEKNTWCPGCPNFGILQAVKGVLADLINEQKIKIKDTAIVTGIGCHAKTFDYINVNAFYGLHGRVLPVCLGVKLANPGLKVLGFGGDGDTYAEGISHFIHACRYNVDIKMIVHNNQVFSLTAGQSTPTTERGYKDIINPEGTKEKPLNPLALALTAGAGFVARAYALDPEHLKEIIKEALDYKGFAFIDVLQPCLMYHNATPYFQKNIYKLEGNYDSINFQSAFSKANEWDYCFDADKKVPIGIFYKVRKATLEEKWPQLTKPFYTIERKFNWQEEIKEFK